MDWGLIGASTIAAEHVIAAIRATGGRIAWVMSGDAAHAARYAQAHGIPAHGSDLAALLADPAVGAVYVSSTNERHREQVLAALAAGKHVLCEKPIATTLADAEAMVEAAEAAGLVLAVNHHLRASGSHRALRDLVQGGRLGRILSMRVHHAGLLPENLRGWRLTDGAAGGGVVLDLTVHNADAVRFILGEDPVEVVAMAAESGLGQGLEDSAMSVWAMPSGVQVFSHDSFTHPFARRGIELHGTLGSAYATGIMAQRPEGQVDLITAAGHEDVPFPRHNLYEETLRSFEAATRGQGAPCASGWDGYLSLSVALAVREAAATGRRCRVGFGG